MAALAHCSRRAIAKNLSSSVHCQGYRDHSLPRDIRKQSRSGLKGSKTAENLMAQGFFVCLIILEFRNKIPSRQRILKTPASSLRRDLRP
jgi:hypothetical protein